MPPILDCTFAAENLNLTEANMAEEWILHKFFCFDFLIQIWLKIFSVYCDFQKWLDFQKLPIFYTNFKNNSGNKNL